MLEIMSNEAESSAKIIVIGVELQLYFRSVRKLPKVLVQEHSLRLDRKQQKRALRK